MVINMMSLEEIRVALKGLSGQKGKKDTLESVARATGLSRPTIVRMRDGDGNSLYKNLELVSDYFEGNLDTE